MKKTVLVFIKSSVTCGLIEHLLPPFMKFVFFSMSKGSLFNLESLTHKIMLFFFLFISFHHLKMFMVCIIFNAYSFKNTELTLEEKKNPNNKSYISK